MAWREGLRVWEAGWWRWRWACPSGCLSFSEGREVGEDGRNGICRSLLEQRDIAGVLRFASQLVDCVVLLILSCQLSLEMQNCCVFDNKM